MKSHRNPDCFKVNPLGLRLSRIYYVVLLLCLATPRARADIFLLASDGPFTVTDLMFVPGGAGGHFGLDTLALAEDGLGFAPWDLLLQVTNIPVGGTAMIGIDKDVTNLIFSKVPLEVTDFHMELGTGLGVAFVQSNETDGLFFKTDPAPVNEAFAPFPQAFPNPPGQDEAIDPDVLWWDSQGTGFPGIQPGDTTSFWFGINVPDDIDGVNDGQAKFTLRQIPTPEPSTAMLLGLAGLLATIRRRR